MHWKAGTKYLIEYNYSPRPINPFLGPQAQKDYNLIDFKKQIWFVITQKKKRNIFVNIYSEEEPYKLLSTCASKVQLQKFLKPHTGVKFW